MADQDIHPDTGAETEDARIWNQLQQTEQAAAAGEAPPNFEQDQAEPVREREQPSTTTTQSEDIWATAPEPLRAAYEATRAQAEQEAINHRRVSGTVSALQRQINELKARPRNPEVKAETADILNSPALKQAAEDYPEAVKPVLDALKAISEQNTALAKRVDGTAQVVEQDKAQQYYASQRNALSQAHPDWQVQAAKPEFTAWLEKQPRYVQEGIARNGTEIVDASEAGDIIGRFKSSIGAQTTQAASQAASQATKRQAQLDGAVAPKGRGGNPKLTTGTPEGSDEEIWEFYRQQDARKARSN